jgi:hypothetical protein
MNLQEINKKIAEYRIELEKQTNYVPIKGGTYVVRQKGISKSLVRHYQQEILKLEIERKEILNLGHSYDITWDQVYFDNNCIRVKFNNQFSEPYGFYPARKSFEYIKTYLTKINLPSLKVTIQGCKILRIQNLEHFSQAVTMLDFKSNMDIFLKNRQVQSVSSILERLENLTNTAIKDILSIRSKGQYLSYLCDIQSVDHKIIPAPEVFIFRNTLKEEDTFIFTIKEVNRILLIWESVNFSRATYIFQADKETYLDKLYNIFGYIISGEKHKRSSLRELIPQSNSINVIEHDDFASWKTKILRLKNDS